MSFVNSSHTTITGENTINHVKGNQVTGTINANTVNFNTRQAVAKRTVCDEFQYVRRGDMIPLKQLGSRDLSEWNWNYCNGRICGRLKAKKKFCTVEVYPDRQSKFTAVVYEGEDARTLWEEDFQQFSCTDDLQLFGINQSEIPALIFHHELIPCAHLYTGSFWMNVYIVHLVKNMGCSDHDLWMNTTSGMLLCGPEGPLTNFRGSLVTSDGSIVVPSTVDMLNDNTSFRFFSKLGSIVDGIVLYCALDCYKYRFLDGLFMWTAEDHQSKDDSHRYRIRDLWHHPPDHLPMDVIGGLRFDTVYSPSLEAVARRPPEAGSLWTWLRIHGLMNVTEMDGGLTRFMFDWVQRERVRVELDWRFWLEWFSQCSHVFDVLGVAEGMQDFFVVQPPILFLEFTPRFPNAEYLFEETTLIYLFLHPPMTISELEPWIEGTPYFWSFDETGQSRVSEEECERWRLPVITISTKSKIILRSWPTHVYTTLRDWQKARGFDPTTSDWAQSMGHPEWEINGAENRFVVVEDIPDEEWEILDA